MIFAARRRHERGFSMVETLVALGIAGLVLSGFYEALSTGTLLGKRAGDQAAKVELAMSVMDRVGIDVPLRPGTLDNGQSGALTWALQVGETPPADMQLGTIYQGELLFVAVTVQDTRDPDATPVVVRAIRYAGGGL